MTALLLISLATLMGEGSQSIGKKQVAQGTQSVYSFGFLTLFFSIFVFLFVLFATPAEFIFSAASLPTFFLRLVLEIIQAYITSLAIIRADRSTFAILRLVTIPLLLFVDVLIGYSLSTTNILGVLLIFGSMLGIFATKSFNRKGAGLVLFTSINAVATLSLYKYNIDNFNSVVAEQLLIITAILIYFYIMARVVTKEKPLHMLKKKVFFFQSSLAGVSSVIESFAYLVAPAASLVVSGKRSTKILWSVLSGRYYFKEKGIVSKLLAFSGMIVGLILLAT